jgi:hypothetical protein
MSLAKSFGSPVMVVLESGEELSFPRLKMKKVADLCEKLSAIREAQATKRAKAAGLTGQAWASFMSAADRSEANIVDLYDWAVTPKGTVAVLTESLSGVEGAEETINALPPELAAVVAKRVLGWTPPEAKEGKQNPRPTDGESSTGSGTDGSSPTSTESTPGN